MQKDSDSQPPSFTQQVQQLFQLLPTSPPHRWLIAADWLEEQGADITAAAFREGSWALNRNAQNVDGYIASYGGHWKREGDSYGYGDDCGTGDGLGQGDGQGDGHGVGEGHGYGYGNGHGYGDGIGISLGVVDGCGDGSGNGYGEGEGNGYGDGEGGGHA